MTADRRACTIVSADNPLAGWVFRPAGATAPTPGIVMAHGFAAVKEMGLDRFATLFADAGCTVVVFDQPCFGGSGGTPRQEVDPDRQLRAFRDAVSWLSGLDGVDPARIGLWGTSLSGGHVVALAASDERVAAAVAQVPFLGPPDADVPAELGELLAVDERQRRQGRDPISLPVVTDDPAGFGALSPDPGAASWFGAMALEAPAWRNEVTLRSIARVLDYRPADVAADVRAPLLLIAERGDVLAPLPIVERAAAAIAAPHELLVLDGGHFDVYGPHFADASQAAVRWFTRWLAP